MRTLLSLLTIWCLAISTTALAKPKKEEDLAKLPLEETCSRDYARWQYLYIAGEINTKAQAKDWVGAIEKANAFKGVGLTCWEQYDLSLHMARIHAANNELNIAYAYLDVANKLQGLLQYQIDYKNDLRTEFESGDWSFQTFKEGRAEAKRLSEINAPDREAFIINKPNVSGIRSKMRGFGVGTVVCFILLDLDKEGKPVDLVSRCSMKEFETIVRRGVAKARFSPKYRDGKPVKKYDVNFPFELRITK